MQAIALADDPNKAMPMLHQALILAESGGFVRAFISYGEAMAKLLSYALAQGIMPEYVGKLSRALSKESKANHPVFDRLSPRELEVLRLIGQGLSNQEISAKLFRALSTVKWHNQKIFDKLQVQSRTEAIVRAQELNLF